MTAYKSGPSPRTRPYNRPSTLQEYLPDLTRPVERWYNRPNSGNVTTAMLTILDLSGQHPTAIVDPFCGAGCSAVVARRLGVPFFGIERDPVLACVADAKATARLGLLHRIRRDPDIATPQGLLTFCQGLAINREKPTDDMRTAALAALMCLTREEGMPISLDDMEADLAESRAQESGIVAEGRVFCGDCREEPAWDGIPFDMCDAVVFTSPPFYRTGIPLNVPEPLRAAASILFPDRTPSPALHEGLCYSDNVVGMLHRLARRLESGWILLEHEPGDASPEGLPAIAHRISHETEFDVQEILTTKAFSKAGALSIVACGRQ
ncbi:hypothetical protein [Streptomyces sp. JNUCC 63]